MRLAGSLLPGSKKTNKMSRIAKSILHSLGWKIDSTLPDHIKKAVVLIAPHTSYWDFFYGRMAFAAYKIKGKYMIKKEAFVFPFGLILKALGGIPVDRSNSRNALKSVKEAFETRDEVFLVVAPEGTRKRVEKWKKGFYFIAKAANVPIILGYIDYSKKYGGFGPVIHPSGDLDSDLKTIEDFYRGKGAKYPEKFNLTE